MIEKKNVSVRWLIGALIILYVAIQSYCINRITFNFDEKNFGMYGFTILKLQGDKDIVKYESKLPIVALNGLPRAIEQLLHPGLEKSDWGHEDFRRGRYVTLIASILLSLLIFQWTKELYGESPALFAFVFYLLCPNFLAHSVFLHTDVYAPLFLTASFYFLWKYHRTDKMKHFILFSLAVAFAEISKFSMIFLYLIIPLLLVTLYLSGLHRTGKRKHSSLALLGIFVLINFFIVSAAHLFYQMFVPLGDYDFRSTTFIALQKIAGFLPMPLPSSYVKSMDAVMFFDEIGNGTPISINGPTYILGKHTAFGVWYFYIVTLFYKVPIATLAIWVCSLIILIKKFSRNSFLRNEFYLLLPVAFYLVYLSLFYNMQLGVRHIIIVFPALFIFSGLFYSMLFSQGKKWILILLLAWQLISVGLYFPHFLPYTNEFIMDKKMAYRKIADTNLSYEEGGHFLQSYLDKNKDAISMPDSIMPGKIVLEANRLLGFFSGGKNEYTFKYIWAKDLVPEGHIHSQYLIYNITPKMADSLHSIYQENIRNEKYTYDSYDY